MKKLILTAGICIASLLCVQAQKAAPTAGEQVEKMMSNITSTCNLTPEQAKSVKPIVTEFVNEKMANKKNAGSDKEKMKEANKASMKTMNEKLAKVLNADQQAKWAEYLKQKQAAKKEKGAEKE